MQTTNTLLAQLAILALVACQPNHVLSQSASENKTTMEVKVSRRGPTADYRISSIQHADISFRPGQYLVFSGSRTSDAGSLLKSVVCRGIRVREAWFTPWRPVGSRASKSAVLLVRVGPDGVPAGTYRRQRDFPDLVIVEDPVGILDSVAVEYYELVSAPPDW